MTDGHDRFVSRRRARRLRSLRPAVVVAVLGVLLATGGWLVGWSSVLDIRTVEVVGADRVPAEVIRAKAAVPIGSPLARVDIGAIGARLRQIPQVADVSVVRRWPHTVRILVEERQPAVAVPADDRFVLVDGDGVSFDTVTERPRAVPLVTGVHAASLSADRVAAVLDVLAALPADVRKRATEISVPTFDSVTVSLDDGVRVVWGSADEGARKAEVLAALMRTKAKIYDVTSPDAPTTQS